MKQLKWAAASSLLVVLAACGGASPNPTDPNTVSGVVLDYQGRAVAGVSVQVNNAGTPITTAADGKFSFAGITPPYSLAVKSDARVSLYVGLTRNNPRVFADGLVGNSAVYSAGVAGTVSGPVYPLPATEGIAVSATGTVYGSVLLGTGLFADQTTGTYNTRMAWAGSPSLTTDLVALRFSLSAGANPTFTGFLQTGKKTGVLLKNDSSLEGQTIALNSNVVNATTVLTYAAGAYTNSAKAGYYSVRAAGALFPFLTLGFPIASGASAIYPAEGASFYLQGRDTAGNAALNVVPVSAATTSLNLPSTVVLKNTQPTAAQTSVSRTPELVWPTVGSASGYILILEGPLSYTIYIPPTLNRFTLPDFAALKATLAASTEYRWQVAAMVNINISPDSLTDPAGDTLVGRLVTSSGFAQYSSAQTSFTTQ